jgi:golgi phosphoprotein 3
MTMNYSMAGAVLMDLALTNKIDTDLDKLIVVDSNPTGIEFLDKYLKMISTGINETNDNTKYWLTEFSNYGDEILNAALDMLVQKNILKLEEKKILWVFGTRRYPIVDDRQEKEVKRRIIDLLMSDEIPSPKDVVLVCLIDTCSLFPSILSDKEVEHLKPRIQKIKKLDLIGQAVTQVLEKLRSDIAEAMLMLPH